jgi:hypothetical protein
MRAMSGLIEPPDGYPRFRRLIARRVRERPDGWEIVVNRPTAALAVVLAAAAGCLPGIGYGLWYV